MADAPPSVCGWKKKDLGVKEARLVAVVENLRKQDEVEVVYPQSCKVHPYLRIAVNGDTMKEKYIPDDVIVKECKYKIKHKRNSDAEIKITLKKQKHGLWASKWSPSHDGLHGNPTPVFPLPSQSDVSMETSHDDSTSSAPKKKKHIGTGKKKSNDTEGETNKDDSSSSESESEEEEELDDDKKVLGQKV